MSNLENRESSHVGPNFLGVIDAFLTSLRGFGVMALELIQNADDAGATEIELDITEMALVVRNNSTFVGCSNIKSDEECLRDAEANGRICDWHSFRDIASGAKTERESAVIGRFGLGFTAVYQITDNPIVESSGVSLRIEPDKRLGFWGKVPNTPDTKFTLPWAMDPKSPVRIKLRSVPGLKANDLDRIHSEIVTTSAESLIFLRNLRKISVTRNGKSVRSFLMTAEDGLNRRSIKQQPSGGTQTFFFASSHDSENLRQLESEFPQEIGSQGRRRSTEIAIPIEFDQSYRGLVYAYLPTQRRTFMPLNINADFFPKHDRKDIILESEKNLDPHSEWNSALIYNAASLLSENLLPLYEVLGTKRFWSLIHSIHAVYEDSSGYAAKVHPIFASFWNRFAIRAQFIPIIPLEAREDVSVLPSAARLLLGEDIKQKRSAAVQLGLNIVSSTLIRHYKVFEELGVENLNFEEIVEGLKQTPWTRDTNLPASQRDELAKSRYIPLYWLLDDYIPKESSSLIDGPLLAEFRKFNLYLTYNLNLSSAENLFYCDRESAVELIQSTFPGFTLVSPTLKDFSKVRNACNPLNAEVFVNHIEKSILTNPEVFTASNYLDIASILVELTKQTQLTEEFTSIVSKIPIWPTRDGNYASAAESLIPGDFNDSLGLASLIDTKKLEKNHIDFLHEKLNVKLLSFESYIREVLPKHFVDKDNHIEVGRYKELLEELSKHLHSFENDKYIDVFSKIPFIKSKLGVFQIPAEMVLINPRMINQLGEEFPFWAEPSYLPETKSVFTLLDLIGVRRKPSAIQLVRLISQICEEAPSIQSRVRVLKILQFLSEKINGYSEVEIKGALKELVGKAYLPCEGNFETWHSPSEILLPDNRVLFSTQTHIKVFDLCGIEFESRNFLTDYLNIRLDPELDDVISHIHAVVQSSDTLSSKVYAFLNRLAGRTTEETIQRKIGALRQIGLFPHNGGFIKPSQFFSESQVVDAPWAFKLPSQLERYSDLLKCLGVKPIPGPEDLISILESIRTDLHLGDTERAPEGILKAYLQCWKSLNSYCSQNQIEEDFYETIATSGLFLNCKNEFVHLDHALVPDSEWFQNKFDSHFSQYFLFESHSYLEILQKLDCGNLSEYIEVAIQDLTLSNKRLDEFTHAIRARSDNFGIVLEKLNDSGSPLKIWENIQVVAAEKISLQWNLQLNLQIANVVEEVEVFLDRKNRTLYLTNGVISEDGSAVWARIFRDVLFHLFPRESENSIPPVSSVLTTLMSLSGSDGFLHLNHIGYVTNSRVDAIDTNLVVEESIVIENEDSYEGDLHIPSSGVTESIQVDADSKSEVVSQNSQKSISDKATPELRSDNETSEYKPIDSSSHSDRASRERNTTQNSGGGASRYSSNEMSTKASSNRDRKNQPSSRTDEQEIRSAYIYSIHAPTEDGSRIQAQKMGNEKISREIAIQHELDEGRTPEDMPGLNAGYDIESTEPGGDIRFIEVKSTAGRWSGAGITLSYSQINFASIKKDAFWLYIVENVSEKSPTLYKIQNPVKYIRGFKFNDAWKELAISIEASHQNLDFTFKGITHEDLGTRILHTDRGECWLIGWLQMGQSIQVTLQFDDDNQLVLPLNITKMKKLDH